MDLRPGLHSVANLDVDSVRHQAETAGYATYVLPADIVDHVSFFDSVRALLPLNPPVVSSRSWDALSDSLWQGLHEFPSRRIAIIWPQAGIMAAAAHAEFDNALNVLEDVANLLGDPAATRGYPKDVVIVVERPT